MTTVPAEKIARRKPDPPQPAREPGDVSRGCPTQRPQPPEAPPDPAALSGAWSRPAARPAAGVPGSASEPRVLVRREGDPGPRARASNAWRAAGRRRTAVKVRTILSDNGPEYRGRKDKPPYELFPRLTRMPSVCSRKAPGLNVVGIQ